MKKSKIILPLAFIFVFIFSILVSAQPPSFQTIIVDEEISIDFPQIMFFQQNRDVFLSFHASNSTTGMRFDNSTVWCVFELVNQTGVHTINEFNMTWDEDGKDFEIHLLGGNFSDLGIMSYLIYCESFTGVGGSIAIGIEVTKTGQQLDTGEALLYILLSVIIFLLIFLVLYLIIILPSENEKDPKRGVIIRVVKLKYLRMVLIGIVYPLIIVILNLMNGIAVNFVTLNIFSGTLGFFFLSMLRLAWIYTIIIMLWIAYNILKDTNVKKLIKSKGYA